MHRDIIIALGGCSSVAAEIQQPRSVVSNWMKRGVPWRWRATVKTLARRKRIKLPPDFLDPGKDAA